MSSLEQSNQNVQALSPYKLNLENLPPEIIGLIIGDSEHNSNASKLCLISKRFFHAAYPRLYSSVSLRWNEGPEDPHTVGTPVAFASSIALKGHTQWRSYLRRMKIMGVMKWNKARYWAIATIARELAKCENVLEFEFVPNILLSFLNKHLQD
ncbi:hypothetical protein L873DRAFT_1792720 [Choiromyces venosus 120613-1]|uniref:F-box domain-containing protein n=1 Tax=Choiromyces venosus 120613-1 TaxID=1336337 RepID=A0A3N4J946_9PEZI|nr:hypothetical protein L873DRAFT_1792720 [Choiromyces venosus 120613-1]